MADLDKAVATQLANIEKRTGKSIAELAAIIESSGLTKHGEQVAMLKRELAMGHGDANTLVGPATNTRVEVGLNMKGVAGTDRLQQLPAGQMCDYKVKLTTVDEVDAELVAWIRQAYDAAG